MYEQACNCRRRQSVLAGSLLLEKSMLSNDEACSVEVAANALRSELLEQGNQLSVELLFRTAQILVQKHIGAFEFFSGRHDCSFLDLVFRAYEERPGSRRHRRARHRDRLVVCRGLGLGAKSHGLQHIILSYLRV